MATRDVEESDIDRAARVMDRQERLISEYKKELQELRGSLAVATDKIAALERQAASSSSPLVTDMEPRPEGEEATEGATAASGGPSEFVFPTTRDGSAGESAQRRSAAAATGTPSSRVHAKLPTFSVTGNVEIFLKKLDNYFTLFPQLGEESKIAMLMSALDDTAFEIIQHIEIPEEHKGDYEYHKTVCKDRFVPATSIAERRLQFRNVKQADTEDLDQFYEKLLTAASKAFPESTADLDLQVGEQFIFGMSDLYLKQRLLEIAPDTSRESLALAKRLLAAMRYTSGSTPKAVTPTVTASTPTVSEPTATDIVHNVSYSQVRGRGRGGRGQGRQQPSRTPDGKPICYRCGKANHIAAHCRAPSATGGSDRGSYSRYQSPGRNDRYASSQWSRSPSPPPSYSSDRSSSSHRRDYPSRDRDTRDYQRRRRDAYDAQELSSLRSSSSHRGDDSSWRRDRDRDHEPYRRDSRDRLYHNDDVSYESVGSGHCRDNNQRDNGQSGRPSDRLSGMTRPKQLIGTISDGKPSVHCMYVRGYVNEMLTYMLVDTGSVHSILSKQFYDAIKSQPVELRPHNAKVFGVTGDAAKVLGVVELPLTFCNKVSNHERMLLNETFMVCEGIEAECILGLSFMSAHKAKVDTDKHVLTLRNGDCTTLHDLVEKDYNTRPVVVSVKGNYVLPARSQCFIACELNPEQCDPDEDWCMVKHVVFTPTEQMHAKYKLLCANCITNVDRTTIKVHVANPTHDDVELRHGTDCGLAEPCDDNFAVYDTYVTGEIVTDNDKDATPPSDLHVRFAETIATTDKNSTKFTADDLAKTRAWIKDSKIDVDLTTFTGEQQQQILQLLTEYQDIFSQHDHDYGLCNLPGCEHTIDIIPNSQPVRSPPHRATPTMREVIEKETRDMLQQGIIRESSGEWTSPVVMSPKKDGSWRFCVSYKKVNDITVADHYPLPNVADCFDSLSGSRLYSTLDLAAGYWQIPMKEEDKCKTGFVNHLGTYEFERLPFGLTNSPARFMRTMDILLKGLKWSTCLVYLDDVITFSKTFSEHLERLTDIFRRFRRANLKLKPKKCHLLKQRIEFLGHEVSADGISPMPSKVKAIKDFPRPTSVKTLQSFLGLANYYRKFYKQNFAILAKPLYQLTEKPKRKDFTWRAEHETAFQALKNAIIEDITLAYPDFSKPFVVQTDAAQFGIGACLMQRQDDGSLRPISFASRTLSKREIQYSTIEKETAAILFACETFYPYLYGKHFTLQCDHKPITYLKVNQHKNPRLSRWLTKLQEFDFDIIHLSGAENVVADALSRAPLSAEPGEVPDSCCYVTSPQLSNISELEASLTLDEIIDAQQEDQTIQRFLRHDKTDNVNATLRALIKHAHYIFEEEGILYLAESEERCKIILPPALHNAVLYELHNQPIAGHGGINKVFKSFRERFYWPGMYSVIANYIKRCQDCQIFKRSYQHTLPELHPIYTSRPMELVQIDCIGPMCTANDGSKYIFTVIDPFTKWAEAYSIANIQTPTIITCLEDWISNHGVMTAVLTDNAKDFTSKLFEAFARAYNITVKHTTPYSPQTNGASERFNGSLIKILQKYVSSTNKEWPELIASALAAYRMSPHTALDGMSPFEALYGRKPVLTCDLSIAPTNVNKPASLQEYHGDFQQRILKIQQDIQHIQQKNKQKMKERYDQKYGTKFYFNVGDKVYLNALAQKKGSCKKLQPLFKGPYEVTERLNEVDYRIRQLNGKEEIVHQRRLKMAYLNESEREVGDADESTGEDDQPEDVEKGKVPAPRRPRDTLAPPGRHKDGGMLRNRENIPAKHDVNEALTRPQSTQQRKFIVPNSDSDDYSDDDLDYFPPRQVARDLVSPRPRVAVQQRDLPTRMASRETAAVPPSFTTPVKSSNEINDKNNHMPPQTEQFTTPSSGRRTGERGTGRAEASPTPQRVDKTPAGGPAVCEPTAKAADDNLLQLRRSTRQRHVPNRYGFSPTFFTSSSLRGTERWQRPPTDKAINLMAAPIQGLKLPSVFIILLCFLAIFTSVDSQLQPVSNVLGTAKLCLKNNHGQLIDLGLPPDCTLHHKPVEVQNLFVTPYFRKLLSDSFLAYACTVETETTITYTNFFGARSVTSHNITYKPADTLTCRNHAHLIEQHQSPLIKIGPYMYVNSTNSPLTYTWCCRDITNTNVKLIVKAIFVSYNYHNNKFFSPTIFLQDCDPTALTCVVNQYTVIWNTSSYDSCSLLQGKTVRAQRRGSEVVSTEGQFAVTLMTESQTLCQNVLRPTFEGVFVHIVVDRDQPFHNLSQTLRAAYQSSNLFLTVAYVSQHLQDIIHERFITNWMAICTMQRNNFYHIRQLTATNQAIVGMRSLLHTDDITAEIKGDLLQITSCLNIPTYYLRNVSSCYNQIPISFQINNHTIDTAFLMNNHLREITYSSTPIPCDNVVQSYYKTNKSDIYLRWTGKTFVAISNMTITHLQTAVAFKETDDFHIYYDKVYDQDEDMIHRLMDLEGLSTKMKAMTDLLTIMTTNTDVSIEQVKYLADQLGTSTDHIIRSAVATVKGFVPSTKTFAIIVIGAIVIIVLLWTLTVCIRLRQTQLHVQVPRQTKLDEAEPSAWTHRASMALHDEQSVAEPIAIPNTTNHTDNVSSVSIALECSKPSLGLMRFRDLLDKYDDS